MFDLAASEVIRMLHNRKVFAEPLELEVSPGHMQNVYNTTAHFKNFATHLTGSLEERMDLSLIWQRFMATRRYARWDDWKDLFPKHMIICVMLLIG